MATMASGEEPNRRTSIANLLIPPADPPSALLSLSLAASMQSAATSSPSARRRRAAADAFARSCSVPHALRPAAAAAASAAAPRSPAPSRDAATPDERRAARMSRSASVAGPSLGIAHLGGKRLSRTKSAFAGRAAMRAAASAAAASSSRDSNIVPPLGESSSEGATLAVHGLSTPTRHAPPPTPSPPPPPHGGPLPSSASLGISPMPSPTVLRPISSNPMGGYASKHTSASNSIESCVPSEDVKHLRSSPSPARHKGEGRGRFQQTGQRYSGAEFASNALARMRSQPSPTRANDQMMDIDAEYEQREPSSSSHDAKLTSRPSRSRTTPDAKRAQNRESAKRFRVAQKKRWAELQKTVEKKDEEISRLKSMLQEVTNQNLTARPMSAKQQESLVSSSADSLAIAELELFVKLMISPTATGRDSLRASSSGGGAHAPQPPLAANIGTLYRVIVSRLDGSVLGVRHQADAGCLAMGGEVGGCIWQHVHSSDSAHLRFTVVHAAKMASVMEGEPSVFSYRRRELNGSGKEENADRESYLRMKGCLYPLADDNGEITSVILAEFLEL